MTAGPEAWSFRWTEPEPFLLLGHERHEVLLGGFAHRHLTGDAAGRIRADALTVFPDTQYKQNSRNYYKYKSQEELTAWNNLFLPITQGS